MNQEKIGKFICLKRIEKKMTQNKLADILGVTDKAVSKWENGRCLPDVSLMIPLSDALGISLNELFKGDSIKDFRIESDENLEKILKEYYRMKKVKNFLFALLIVVFAWLIQGAGFDEKYELLAMNADEYQCFIYALNEIGTNKIIYVELIFCNYFMDIDYNEYINQEYLPLGFNAKQDNPYRDKKLKESNNS